LFEIITPINNENEIDDEDEEDSENNMRPEINGEYEQELGEEKLKFKCEKLIKTKVNTIMKNCELLYLFKLIPSDNYKVEEEIQSFEREVSMFINLNKNRHNFICRIYLINLSNLLLDDLKGKKGLFRIKRYDKDIDYYKTEKEFDMDQGEINDVVELQLKWPVRKIFFVLKD